MVFKPIKQNLLCWTLVALMFGTCFVNPKRVAACTMEPAVWREISTNTECFFPSTYGLVEGFLQIKKRFEMDMRASKMPIKPLVLTNLSIKDELEFDVDAYENIAHAVGVVWKNATLLPKDKLGSELVGDYEVPEGVYGMGIELDKCRKTTVAMIDLNPQVFSLLRLVVRDEFKVFVRITDETGMAVFIEELEVSPTLVVDPLLSPLGGFFVRIEKNNFYPAVMDFGSVEEGGEHVFRINNAFYQPMVVPPLMEFRTPLMEAIEAEEEQERIYGTLVFAIKSLDLEFFNVILETYPKFDVNLRKGHEEPLIHFACRASAVEMVKALLDRGARPEATNQAGETALHVAMQIDALCMAPTNEEADLTICPLTIPKMLVDAGVDANGLNDDGDAALHLAAKNGLVGVIATLISSGAQVNLQNHAGNTPLHCIEKVMARACAQVLLSYGADIKIKNNRGQTPIDKAMEDVNAHLVNVLNEYNN
jgi:hypothetical protein